MGKSPTGEGTWHESVEDGDPYIRNAHILVVVGVMVDRGCVDGVRAADWCIDWQLGIDAQIFDSNLIMVVLHDR